MRLGCHQNTGIVGICLYLTRRFMLVSSSILITGTGTIMVPHSSRDVGVSPTSPPHISWSHVLLVLCDFPLDSLASFCSPNEGPHTLQILGHTNGYRTTLGPNPNQSNYIPSCSEPLLRSPWSCDIEFDRIAAWYRSTVKRWLFNFLVPNATRVH